MLVPPPPQKICDYAQDFVIDEKFNFEVCKTSNPFGLVTVTLHLLGMPYSLLPLYQQATSSAIFVKKVECRGKSSFKFQYHLHIG
jgi:hypothetical protein